MPYFKVFLDRAGEYRWTLIAGNGEPVATSEGYTTRYNAERAIEAVKRIVPVAMIHRV